MADLEGRGVPTVYVASSEFEEAGADQAKALGSDLASVFVPHPIQDRTDEEMTRLADDAFDAIVAELVAAKR